jgi:hypothetical protein
MRFLLAAMAVLLSAVVFFLARQNIALRKSLDASITTAETAVSACTLPPLTGFTAADTTFNLDFPRPKPVLILVADRNCPYCGSALKNWAALEKQFPTVDALIYDKKRSYARSDWEGAGIQLQHVLVSVPPIMPYNQILTGTPTVVLISRNGGVLGSWKGELNGQLLGKITTSVSTLL